MTDTKRIARIKGLRNAYRISAMNNFVKAALSVAVAMWGYKSMENAHATEPLAPTTETYIVPNEANIPLKATVINGVNEIQDWATVMKWIAIAAMAASAIGNTATTANNMHLSSRADKLICRAQAKKSR